METRLSLSPPPDTREVSEGLNSVETSLLQHYTAEGIPFQKDLIVWKHPTGEYGVEIPPCFRRT